MRVLFLNAEQLLKEVNDHADRGQRAVPLHQDTAKPRGGKLRLQLFRVDRVFPQQPRGGIAKKDCLRTFLRMHLECQIVINSFGSCFLWM